ncbi:hypothetical protein, partial [Burkholderia pseudomallei]
WKPFSQVSTGPKIPGQVRGASGASDDCIHVLLTDAWAKESSPRLLRQRDESHERAFNGGSLGFRLLPNYRYSYGDHATAS